jgi:hypothetical protein
MFWPVAFKKSAMVGSRLLELLVLVLLPPSELQEEEHKLPLTLTQDLWDGLLRILDSDVVGVTSTAIISSFICITNPSNHSALQFFLQGHDQSIRVVTIVIAVAAVVAHDHADVIV